MQIMDFSDWKEYDGLSEGSGRSEKIWLTNGEGKIGLFKFPKIDPSSNHETTEHISEHLAYKLGECLGVETAKIDIGYYYGRIGSMSYLIPKSTEILIEGINYISRLLPSYDANKMVDLESGDYYCIDHILKSTEHLDIESAWITMMLFDFLIGNADRHQNNWAVLSFLDATGENTSSKKCPLYDNGSSLCCYVNDEQMKKINSKDMGPFKSLVDTKSRSVIRIDPKKKTQPKHSEVVKYLLVTYPETAVIAHDFLQRLSPQKIDILLDQYPEYILSNEKNKLIRRYLKKKLGILNQLVEEGLL